MEEVQTEGSTIVSVLNWVVLILLSPLYSFLLPITSVGFRLLYVMAFRVVNRTSQPIWVTPVGTFDSGEKAILPQFVAGLPPLPPFPHKNRRVPLPGPNRLHFYPTNLA